MIHQSTNFYSCNIIRAGEVGLIVFDAPISNISVISVSFIGLGNDLSQVTDKLYHLMLKIKNKVLAFL